MGSMIIQVGSADREVFWVSPVVFQGKLVLTVIVQRPLSARAVATIPLNSSVCGVIGRQAHGSFPRAEG
jgi:hypothetical protein